MSSYQQVRTQIIQNIQLQYPNQFRLFKNQLYCLVCQKMIAANREVFHFNIKGHLNSTSHKTKLRNSLGSVRSPRRSFKALLLEEEPISPLPPTPVNPSAGFLPWCSKPAPVDVLPESYTRHSMANNIIAGQYIWFGIEEGRDEQMRSVVIFTFGVLNEQQRSNRFRLSAAALSSVNADVIVHLFELNVENLRVTKDQVLLLITNVHSVDMQKALQKINHNFPKMIHIECLGRTYIDIDSYIMSQFPEINELINKVYYIFLQWPNLYSRFKANFQRKSTPPPEPKPGSWIDTAIYFADNFKDLKRFINSLPQYTAEIVIEQAKIAFNKDGVKESLRSIRKNFACLSKSLPVIRMPGQSLCTAYEEFKSVLEKFDALPDVRYADKLRHLLGRNAGMREIVEIVGVLSEIMTECKLDVTTTRGHTRAELKALSYIPLVGM